MSNPISSPLPKQQQQQQQENVVHSPTLASHNNNNLKQQQQMQLQQQQHSSSSPTTMPPSLRHLFETTELGSLYHSNKDSMIQSPSKRIQLSTPPVSMQQRDSTNINGTAAAATMESSVSSSPRSGASAETQSSTPPRHSNTNNNKQPSLKSPSSGTTSSTSIISIHSNQTFYDALYLMNRYRILSVCCIEEKRRNANSHHHEENAATTASSSRHATFATTTTSPSHTESLQQTRDTTILGFLSNLDILFYLSETLLLFDFEDLSSESTTLRQCLERPIKYLMHQKLETEHYHSVEETESVWTLVERKFAAGVHRVIVMRAPHLDSESPQNGSAATSAQHEQQHQGHHFHTQNHEQQHELVGMISQSDIIQFCNRSQWKDQPFHVKHFLDTMWTDRQVITVYEDDSLLEALKQMATHSLSAVGVLQRNSEDSEQHTGKLVGNFSASDLRRIIQQVATPEDSPGDSLVHDDTQTLSQYFNMKIRDYLNRFSKRSLNPITISSNETDMTMRGIIELFAREKIHRVWIVDEEKRPRGLLSITDLCEFMVEADEMEE